MPLLRYVCHRQTAMNELIGCPGIAQDVPSGANFRAYCCPRYCYSSGRLYYDVNWRKPVPDTCAEGSDCGYCNCGLQPVELISCNIDVMISRRLCRQGSRWGEDPHEFIPSRWLNGMTTQGEALGPHANLSVNFIIISCLVFNPRAG
jgi:hypothetical protein